MEQAVADFIEKYGIGLYIPKVHVTDVIEVLILTFLIYQIIVWIKNTKAWMLLRGIIVLAGFILLAAIFKMHTILFIARNSLTVMATAAIVVFQPELRRALEKLGEKQFLTSVVPFEQNREIRFSEETRENIIRACFAMGKVKTGALIVVEQAIRLTEYESTGIQMDCLVSSQVLENIFEHNTPLHDGAIIIRGDRIVSATADNTASSCFPSPHRGRLPARPRASRTRRTDAVRAAREAGCGAARWSPGRRGRPQDRAGSGTGRSSAAPVPRPHSPSTVCSDREIRGIPPDRL